MEIVRLMTGSASMFISYKESSGWMVTLFLLIMWGITIALLVRERKLNKTTS